MALEADEGEVMDLLYRISPTTAGGMGGFQPIGWIDLWAFSEITCQPITPGIAELLRDMSRAFVDGLQRGTNPLGREPLDDDT